MTARELKALANRLELPRHFEDVETLLELVAKKRGHRKTYRAELPSTVRVLSDALAALNAALDQYEAETRDHMGDSH
jgi:hypothetical protein